MVQSKIIENILHVLTEHIKSENKDLDSADKILDTVHNIVDSVQQSIGISSDKKLFLRNLSKLFAVLLNTNYNTVEKIKRVIKIAIETMLTLWPEPRQHQEDNCQQYRKVK